MSHRICIVRLRLPASIGEAADRRYGDIPTSNFVVWMNSFAFAPIVIAFVQCPFAVGRSSSAGSSRRASSPRGRTGRREMSQITTAAAKRNASTRRRTATMMPIPSPCAAACQGPRPRLPSRCPSQSVCPGHVLRCWVRGTRPLLSSPQIDPPTSLARRVTAREASAEYHHARGSCAQPRPSSDRAPARSHLPTSPASTAPTTPPAHPPSSTAASAPHNTSSSTEPDVATTG